MATIALLLFRILAQPSFFQEFLDLFVGKLIRIHAVDGLAIPG